MKAIGTILLIEHSGKPVEWPVYESDDTEDQSQMTTVFENVKRMCEYELKLGGTLKLIDSNGNLIAEQRGRVISANPLYNRSVTKEAT